VVISLINPDSGLMILDLEPQKNDRCTVLVDGGLYCAALLRRPCRRG
jgi:hypothetical protein